MSRKAKNEARVGWKHAQLHDLGKRFMWRCHFCRVKVHCRECEPNNGNDQLAATRDHYMPKSKGGRNRGPNIVLACKGCNSRKGDLIPEDRRDFRRWVGAS